MHLSHMRSAKRNQKLSNQENKAMLKDLEPVEKAPIVRIGERARQSAVDFTVAAKTFIQVVSEITQALGASTLDECLGPEAAVEYAELLEKAAAVLLEHDKLDPKWLNRLDAVRQTIASKVKGVAATIR